MTHPFWTEVALSLLPQSLDDAELVHALRNEVAAEGPEAAVVICRP